MDFSLEIRFNFRWALGRDLLHQRLQAGGVEGHPKASELIGHAAQGPDVAAEGVGLLHADLRAQVVGRADGGLRKGAGVLQHLHSILRLYFQRHSIAYSYIKLYITYYIFICY